MTHLRPPVHRVQDAVACLRSPTEHLPAATVELVKRLVYPEHPCPPARIDFCLVLGSRNCGYRVKAALTLCAAQETRFIVSGGGMVNETETEADHMRSILLSVGTPPNRIFSDTKATNTHDNIRHAVPTIDRHCPPGGSCNILLVTGGFHLIRALATARAQLAHRPRFRVFPGPAYGPNTHPRNWHQTRLGRTVLGDELEKLHRLGLIPETS